MQDQCAAWHHLGAHVDCHDLNINCGEIPTRKSHTHIYLYLSIYIYIYITSHIYTYTSRHIISIQPYVYTYDSIYIYIYWCIYLGIWEGQSLQWFWSMELRNREWITIPWWNIDNNETIFKTLFFMGSIVLKLAQGTWTSWFSQVQQATSLLRRLCSQPSSG